MTYRKKYNGNLDADVEKSALLEDKNKDTVGKELALVLLTLLFSAASWIFIKIVLLENIFILGFGQEIDVNERILSYAGVSILLMCAHLALMSLTVKLVRHSVSVLMLFFIGIIPLMVFFFISPYYVLLGSTIYIFVLFIWFAVAKKADKKEGDFSLLRTLRPGLSFILLFTIALISFLRFADYLENDNDSNSFQEATISYTLLGINEVFGIIFKGYSDEMSVDEFIILLSGTDGTNECVLKEQKKVIKGLLGDLPIEFNVDVNANVLEEQKAVLRNSFFENLKLTGYGFTGETPIPDVWRAFLQSRSARYTKNLDQFIPAIATLGLFFTLYIFKLLYKLIVYLLGYIILHILLLTNFFTWKKKEVLVKELKL